MWVGLIQSVKKTLEKTTEVPPSEERGFLPLYLNCTINYQGFCDGSDGKESACKARDLGLIPESGTSTGEENGTHSSILAWRIPWAEPGGLSSMGSQRVRLDWAANTSAINSSWVLSQLAVLKILDLPAPTITWAKSLKKKSIYLSIILLVLFLHKTH